MRTVLSIALLAACSSSTGHQPKKIGTDEAAKLLLDRNWIDRMPETEKDRLHVYRFVPSMGGGVYQDRTLFKGTFELFSFKVEGDQIRFVLHETEQDERSRFQIEEVDGPEPFDLKLTIAADPRGPKVFYGMRSETDRDGVKLETRLRTAQLPR